MFPPFPELAGQSVHSLQNLLPLLLLRVLLLLKLTPLPAISQEPRAAAIMGPLQTHPPTRSPRNQSCLLINFINQPANPYPAVQPDLHQQRQCPVWSDCGVVLPGGWQSQGGLPYGQYPCWGRREGDCRGVAAECGGREQFTVCHREQKFGEHQIYAADEPNDEPLGRAHRGHFYQRYASTNLEIKL